MYNHIVILYDDIKNGKLLTKTFESTIIKYLWEKMKQRKTFLIYCQERLFTTFGSYDLKWRPKNSYEVMVLPKTFKSIDSHMINLTANIFVHMINFSAKILKLNFKMIFHIGSNRMLIYYDC